MIQNGDKVLTIAIPAFNAESSISRTLSSVTTGIDADLLEMIDIIVVDDGSSDRTADIAKGFAENYPDSVRVVSKANGGYGSAVNTALQEAKGTYFKLLDADDTFIQAGLTGLIKYLESASADLVINPYVNKRITDAGSIIRVEEDRHPLIQAEPVRVEDADTDCGLAVFEICVRTEVLISRGLRLTEKCFYTDNEFVMASLMWSRDIVRLPYYVYEYSLGISGQSMSIGGRRKHFDDKIKASFGVFMLYDSSCSGTRRLMAEELLSTMVREVYVAALIQKEPMSFRERLKEYDEELDRRWPFAVELSGRSRLVNAARNSGNTVFRLLALKTLRDEKKRTGIVTVPDWYRVSEYTVAACMIIQCRTIYMHLIDYGMYVNRITWLIMVTALMICVFFSREGRPSANMRLFAIAAIAAVYAGLFISVNPVNALRVIRCVSAASAMLMLVQSSEGRYKACDILKAFRNIVFVVAGVSLFCWVLGSTLHMLPGTDFVYIDWSPSGNYVSRPTFINIYFETQWTGWEIIPARNSGIFTEAPMAGFIFDLGLLIENFMISCEDRNRHIAANVLLILTVFSTFSLVSFVFLLLLAVMKVFDGTSRTREFIRKNRKKTAFAAAAALFIAVYSARGKISAGSGMIRFNDFCVGFKAWLEHPLFGGGFEDLTYLQRFMPEWRSMPSVRDIGFSNSPMEILAQGGLYIAAPYLYAFISSFVKAVRCREFRWTASVLLFAYLFSLTAVPYQYITFFMLIILLKNE